MINKLFILLTPFVGLSKIFIPDRKGAEVDDIQVSRDSLLVYISVITSFFALLYAMISYMIDFHLGIWFELICWGLLILNLIYFKLKMNYKRSANLYIANSLFVSILGCSYFTGGIHSQVTPWFTLIVITSVLLLGIEINTLFWLAISVMIMITYGILDIIGLDAPELYNTEYTGFFFMICTAGLTTIIFLIAAVFEYNRLNALNEVILKNEELDHAKSKAEEATYAKSIFLANMSHEIRTPMNAIIGFANLAMKTDMTSKQRDYITKIENASKLMMNLLNDILDVSKIEAGKLEISELEFNLEEVFESISNNIALKAAEKGIEYINYIEGNVPNYLIGDPFRLGQILLNLATNALKFTHEGHIAMIAHVDEITSTDCILRFTVEDTGIGISEDNIHKLFQSFTQADNSITRKFGGTGLGLSISRELAHKMGGDITVESSEGHGSIFTVTVKMKLQALKSQTTIMATEALQGMNILVVDDNALARELICEQLKEMKFNCECVVSGESAIDHLTNSKGLKKYDLIIMDWQMPGLDGIQTTKLIYEDQSLGYTPLVLMISAHLREDIIQSAEAIGIKTFIIKPVNHSLLYDAIVETLGISRLSKRQANNDLKDQCQINFNKKRVLIAEDNLMNQQITVEILEEAGLETFVVNNGKSASEMAIENQYDLILMDLHMPIMDGYEATRLIREVKSTEALPIIAITADAIKGIREACLSAGMNDYVSKPIDPRHLIETISKYLEHDILVSEKAIENKREDISDFIDISKLNASEIDLYDGINRLNSNPMFYFKTLDSFLDRIDEQIMTLEDHFTENDIDGIKYLSHSLKGISANLSLIRISQLLFSLDKIMNTTLDLKAAKVLFNELKMAVSDFKAVYELARIKHSTTHRHELAKRIDATNQSQLSSLSTLIIQQLKDMDYEVTITLETFLNQIDQDIFAHNIQELNKTLLTFDYDQVLALFLELLKALGIRKGELV